MGEQLKEITEELILQELENRGVQDEDSYDGDAALEELKEHHMFTITDMWPSPCPDFAIYRQETADGYEVWVAHDPNSKKIDVSTDVHYYDSDLADVLAEVIQEHHIESIYVDDLEEQYVQDAIENVYDIMREEIIERIVEDLTEQGYEYNNNK